MDNRQLEQLYLFSFIDFLKYRSGYKSCHVIEGYNASACASDCKTFEKSEFAKNCTNTDGLFKCCIRRDKYCDKCRFCCTLPICTTKQEDGEVRNDYDLGKDEEKAKELSNFPLKLVGDNFQDANTIYEQDAGTHAET